jgi:aconitate hydratase
MIKIIETYLRSVGLFVDYNDANFNPAYTKVIELDLSTIVPCVSGPKRPQDRVPLESLKSEFLNGLTEKISFKAFGLNEEDAKKTVKFQLDGTECEIKHGSVVISAITSCTNTSNPGVMLAAGLLARKAVQLGLTVPAYVKTSLSPGSGVVTKYLETSRLLADLQTLGYFH